MVMGVGVDVGVDVGVGGRIRGTMPQVLAPVVRYFDTSSRVHVSAVRYDGT